jgi:hypothetical protein
MGFSGKPWQYFIFLVETNYLHRHLYSLMAIWFSGRCPTWNILFCLFKFTDHISRLRVSTQWFICEEKPCNECKDTAIHYYLNFSCEVPRCLMSAGGRTFKPAILKLSQYGSVSCCSLSHKWNTTSLSVSESARRCVQCYLLYVSKWKAGERNING